MRAALFFTHSHEAPSLVDRVQYTDLAAGCRQVVRKIWDIVFDFVTGYDGKGGCTRVHHTLLKVTIGLISYFKMFMSYFFVSSF